MSKWKCTTASTLSVHHTGDDSHFFILEWEDGMSSRSVFLDFAPCDNASHIKPTPSPKFVKKNNERTSNPISPTGSFSRYAFLYSYQFMYDMYVLISLCLLCMFLSVYVCCACSYQSMFVVYVLISLCSLCMFLSVYVCCVCSYQSMFVVYVLISL